MTNYVRPAQPFGRTVGAEIARQAQQHTHPAVAPRRDEAALATLLRARQRGDAQRQEQWVRRAPETPPRPPHADVIEHLAVRLVPPSLWAMVEPLIPPAKVRRQGGGRGRVSDRAIFTAIVFVLTSGCAWRHLPATFGVTVPTVHRRFQEWTDAGLWLRLRRVALESSSGESEWLRLVLDAAERRGTRAAG
ncbi:transposase [Actinosynnema sp. CS-041913]|uniref:transposase n=1 Tax=Actinosynnema sp. CS-041913 TaxID=3239917 RepID=UPI003D8A4569